MDVTDQLIKVVPNAAELRINEATERIILGDCFGPFGIFVEHEGTTKMNRAHTDYFRTLLHALKLCSREAEIELFAAGFCFCRPSHSHFLGRAHASWGLGAISAAPNEKPFA